VHHGMENPNKQILNILKQIEGTTIAINTHAEGHFISKAQVLAIRDSLSASTFSPSLSSKFGRIFCKPISLFRK
jgi:hypothetical protein